MMLLASKLTQNHYFLIVTMLMIGYALFVSRHFGIGKWFQYVLFVVEKVQPLHFAQRKGVFIGACLKSFGSVIFVADNYWRIFDDYI